MNIIEYLQYFDSVTKGKHLVPPYNDFEYLNYSKLNWQRQQRWLKSGKINDELISVVRNINAKQKWVFITEPWCGDAPHVLPFIWNLSVFNDNIEIDVQLRDSHPFLIDQYLSGGKRSIPKFIVRNESGIDLFVWGPRPRDCQHLYDTLKSEGIEREQIHIALQNWYNHDKGFSLQNELFARFAMISG